MSWWLSCPPAARALQGFALVQPVHLHLQGKREKLHVGEESPSSGAGTVFSMPRMERRKETALTGPKWSCNEKGKQQHVVCMSEMSNWRSSRSVIKPSRWRKREHLGGGNDSWLIQWEVFSSLPGSMYLCVVNSLASKTPWATVLRGPKLFNPITYFFCINLFMHLPFYLSVYLSATFHLILPIDLVKHTSRKWDSSVVPFPGSLSSPHTPGAEMHFSGQEAYFISPS